MKLKIGFFACMLCLSLLFSLLSFSPVEANSEFAAPITPPMNGLPSDDTYTKTPTFYWRAVSGATYYKISVFRKSDNQQIIYGLVLNSGAVCHFRYCKYTPTTANYVNPIANNTEYKWKIVAGNTDGLGPYSSYLDFKVLPGISSSFNSNTTGWSRVNGTWMRSSSGYYMGTHVANGYYISVSHANEFENFFMEAKISRTSVENGSYGIVIRGNPLLLSANKMWDTGYLFLLDDKNNAFIVLKETGGGAKVALILWTETEVINPDGWNILKVNAYYNYLQFYINGQFVGTVYDSTFSSGRVGIIGWYDEYGVKVDYVKLTMPIPNYSFVTEVSAATRPADCPPDPRGCFPNP